VLQAKTAYVDAARPFDQLEALAAAVAGAPATGAGRAARLLRAQAAHLRAGGTTALLHWPRSPGTSPAWWEAPGWLGAPPGCSTELRLAACRSALRAASHRWRRASRSNVHYMRKMADA